VLCPLNGGAQVDPQYRLKFVELVEDRQVFRRRGSSPNRG